MKLNFDEKGQEVINDLNARLGVKESEKTKIFTDEETAELKSALDAGGMFVTIWNDPSRCAVVIEPVCSKEIAQLSEAVSLKLFELYNDPLPMGFHQRYLSAIIDQYC